MPFAKLFRSRWSAMLWAGGILWTAYDVAGEAPSDEGPTNTMQPAAAVDATGSPVHASDLAILAHFGDDGHR